MDSITLEVLREKNLKVFQDKILDIMVFLDSVLGWDKSNDEMKSYLRQIEKIHKTLRLKNK